MSESVCESDALVVCVCVCAILLAHVKKKKKKKKMLMIMMIYACYDAINTTVFVPDTAMHAMHHATHAMHAMLLLLLPPSTTQISQKTTVESFHAIEEEMRIESLTVYAMHAMHHAMHAMPLLEQRIKLLMLSFLVYNARQTSKTIDLSTHFSPLSVVHRRNKSLVALVLW